MALAAERVLGRRITAGLVNVKYGNTAKLRRIELNPCGHPLPDQPGETSVSSPLPMLRVVPESFTGENHAA